MSQCFCTGPYPCKCQAEFTRLQKEIDLLTSSPSGKAEGCNPSIESSILSEVSGRVDHRGSVAAKEGRDTKGQLHSTATETSEMKRATPSGATSKRADDSARRGTGRGQR